MLISASPHVLPHTTLTRAARRCAELCLLLMTVLTTSALQAANTQTEQAEPELPATVPFTHLSERTDAELSGLTARWAQLTPAQRRVLLAEVRGRMARNNAAGVRRLRERVLLERQYGQVGRKQIPNRVLRKTTKVRQPDGSVVVRTEVVQVTPDGKARGVRSTVTFGVGFERRQRPADQAGEAPSVAHTPVVTVNDQTNRSIVPADQP